MSTSGADCHVAVAFHQISANLEVGPTGLISNAAWDHFRVSLLAKCDTPKAFKVFRPIAASMAC